jgi:DNA-binding PadR family transcriptional regulator
LGELITEGALYPACINWEAEGILDVEIAKRMRKYYKLTEKGGEGNRESLIRARRFY